MIFKPFHCALSTQKPSRQMTRLDAVSQQSLTQHQSGLSHEMAADDNRDTSTVLEHFRISNTTSVNSVLLAHSNLSPKGCQPQKGWVSTRLYSLACPKTPLTSQKATFHICSIFKQAKWVDLAQGSTFLSLSTFFCHFVSQEIFYVATIHCNI